MFLDSLSWLQNSTVFFWLTILSPCLCPPCVASCDILSLWITSWICDYDIGISMYQSFPQQCPATTLVHFEKEKLICKIVGEGVFSTNMYLSEILYSSNLSLLKYPHKINFLLFFAPPLSSPLLPLSSPLPLSFTPFSPEKLTWSSMFFSLCCQIGTEIYGKLKLLIFI